MAAPFKGPNRANALLMCDFDGTLFNGMRAKGEAHHAAWSKEFPRRKFEKEDIIARFMSHGGKPIETIMRETAKELGLEPSGEAFKRMVQTYLDEEPKLTAAKSAFFPDTKHLSGLQELGVAVGITTGSPQKDLRDLIERHGLTRVFSFIGGWDKGRSVAGGSEWKKGQAHLDLIEKWAGRKLPVYYYGDTIADIDFAKQLGSKAMFMREGTLN